MKLLKDTIDHGSILIVEDNRRKVAAGNKAANGK
jgi:hypothetical protein